MSKLHIDLESRSAVDLRRAGVHVYAADASTSIWCAAFAVDDGPVDLWLPGDPCPDAVRRAVAEGWQIFAHNFAFERTMWRHILAARHGWPQPKLTQWRCTMAMALSMALPASLENAAAAVGLSFRKDMEGNNVMMKMARPRRPRKGENPNGQYWFDDEERKQKLYAYCKTDVEVERELEKRLVQLRPAELQLFWLDAVINERGVYVDTALCEAALKVVDQAATWLDAEMAQITRGKVGACTNVGEITAWLRANGCPEVDSIAKGEIDALLARHDISPTVRRVLELRKEAAKASVAKIDALLRGKNDDNRARGLCQYHAASTGRWGGRRFQPQNIKRPDMDDIDGAIAAVRSGDAGTVGLLCGEPLAVVGDCLRGMVAAAPGKRLVAADFSNIEGRVQAWFGGEDWKLDAFRAFDAGTGHDLYKIAYAKSFGIRPEQVDKPQRQVGKVMELALGYAGGVGAFQKMAVGYGVEVSDDKADELKVAWREAHPGIVRFWYDLERAAIAAVRNPGKPTHCRQIVFRMAGSFCWMRLPSGRAICYPYPEIRQQMTPWGEARPAFSYMGVNSYTRKWERCYAHGGVLFNNVVQGAARDVMAEAMVRVERAGYPVILHVHDEIVCERRIGEGSLPEFQRLMTAVPAWASGLPVAAGGFEAERYRK